MMPEISMNVLDIAQNSVRAEASLVQITVDIDSEADRLSIIISDDGCGMSAEQVERVTDPFFTTRTTRKVGLGVPFYKMAAICTGGEFDIQSKPGEGTVVRAVFGLSHIDRMPLGDMNSTIHTLIVYNTHMDFVYSYSHDGRGFTLDTREFRQILGDVPLDVPEVSEYIMDYLRENQEEADQGSMV